MTIEDPFQLKPDVISSLLAKFPAHAIEEMQGKKLYPSDEQMEQMTKTAFWATLATEERVAIAFSLQFTEPQSGELGDSYIFSEPVVFEQENLTKLALSVDSRKRFGVFPGSDGTLKIWGFGTKSLIEKFNITTFGVGRIVVSLGHHSLLLTGDKARFVMRSDDLQKTVFWRKSADIFSLAAGDDLCRKYLTIRFLKSCRYILSVIREKKHGGTLLVTAANADWKSSFEKLRYGNLESWSKPAHAFEPILEQFHRRHEFIDAGQMERSIYPEENWRLEDSYRQSLDDIASLANIDGAVVVDYNLNVLAFGAKIRRSTDQPENMLLFQYPFKDDQTGDTAKPAWGTRHQSAADFALERKNSIAFVSSEDGAATAFAFDSKSNKVIAFRNLEYIQEGKFG